MSEADKHVNEASEGDIVVVDDGSLTVDAETQARLEALLEAAGIGKLSTSDGKAFADPDVLHRLTSTVSFALDEAAAALSRLRAETGNQRPLRSLPEACSDGDVATVRRLLKEGQSVHETSEEGEGLLSLACQAGYYELAEVLLSMNANTEEPLSPKGGRTPLMEACSGGFTEVVRLLVAHGADVNAVCNSGNTALTLACCGGYLDIVTLLIAANADLEVQNENGHTPLMEAASGGHVAVAEILLSSGAGINTHSNEFKESALTLACYKGHLEMVRFLLEAGADQEHKTDEMHTALMEASMDGHVDVAKLLLDSGAQVNMPNDSFESPLTLAACGGHTALATLLLSRGASLEEVNDEGYTPLMEASREGHENMLSLLLSHGADVNAITDETQETALTLAACGGFMECCKLLIGAGADLEAGCSTALMEASQEGHLELVHYLLQQGSKVDSQTSSGSTALSYACEHGRTDVADALLTAGAFLEHESEGGRTPLMKACRAGQLCTVQYLLSRGANMNKLTRNKEHTALSLACLYGHSSIVELLLLRGANPNIKLKDGSNLLLEACKGGQASIVQTLLELPRLPSLPSYSIDSVQSKSNSIEEYPSRVPTQTLPIVVPPHEPDPSSLNEEKPNTPNDSQVSCEPPVNPGMELSELEERIKKIIETNVKLKVVESKPTLQVTPGAEDTSRIIKKQRILEELQKLTSQAELDLQGKAAQQLKNCLDCAEYDETKMMERDLPDGCDVATEEKECSDCAEAIVQDGNKEEQMHEENGGNMSPTASTFSLGKASTLSEDYEGIFDVNCYTDSNHDSPLGIAAAGGHLELVRLLLRRNADLEHRDKKGFTPFILSCTNGHIPVINELLDNNANIEAQSERTKDTALSLACSGGRMFVVQTLVDRAANIEHRNVSDYTPLSLAASGGFVRIIELLLHAGAEINSRTGSKLGISPLMLAAMNGHTDAVLTLLDMGADINAQIETNRNTALTLACFQGRHEVVSLLVERRANVEHRAKTGLTPLMEAASGGYAEVGKVLLDKGSDPNAPPVPSSRDTALTIAADKGHLRFCELMLSRGAYVDARNKKGNTPFWLACNGGYLDVAKLLVNRGGALIDAVDNRNVTALMAAFRRGHIKVVKWLSKIASHFPSDSDCMRFMSTITDRDLLKRCHMCAECIAAAKERQAQEANKFASALLEEIDLEKSREESRREKAARKREKRKKKRQERQTIAKLDETNNSCENQSNGPEFEKVEESIAQPPPLEPDTVPKEKSVIRPTKSPIVKSTSTPQQHSKKPHRKDEEWKEVVRKYIKSKKVSVPSNLIARIIGRGGCNINAIREETGAHIDINRQKKGLERTITIKGPNSAIRHAYSLISELMKDENSNKDISAIFKTVKRDDSVSSEDRPTKKNICNSSLSSQDSRSDTQSVQTTMECSLSPIVTTSEKRKQKPVPCNTPPPPPSTSSADVSSFNILPLSSSDPLPSPKSSVANDLQSSPANEAALQFTPKHPNKTVNRPVQPVAPMIATTPKSIQTPPTQVNTPLRSIARVEPQWQSNHQPSPQHQVISSMKAMNLSDMRHLYPNNFSQRQDEDRGLRSSNFIGDSGSTVMHPTSQATQQVSGSFGSIQTDTIQQQRKPIYPPIGTERAFHHRRAMPTNDVMLERSWSNNWEIGNGLHWMDKQAQNILNMHQNASQMSRDISSFSSTPMMQGDIGMRNMTHNRNSQQSLHSERSLGVHVGGCQMSANQGIPPLPMNYFERERLRTTLPFSNPESAPGHHPMSGPSSWPFISQQTTMPIHPQRAPLDPIGQMKQARNMTVAIENKSINYTVDTLPGLQLQNSGIRMTTADANGLHGTSGSATYVNPNSNQMWKW